MTLLNWSVFVEKFQLFRNRVEDRSEGEEYRLLMEKLPEKWKRVVLNEESKRKKFKWVVRLTHVPPMSAEQLKVALEGTLEMGLVKVEASSHGMLVTCGSEIVMQKVMNLSGWSLHGTTVKTAKLEMMMSGDEICEFITEKLELDEKVKTFSTPEPPPGTQGTTWVKKGEVKEADVVSEKKREKSQSPPRSSGSSTGNFRGRSNDWYEPNHYQGKSYADAVKGKGGSWNDFGKGKGSGKGFGKGKGGRTDHGGYTCNPCMDAGRSYTHYHRDCHYLRPQSLKGNEKAAPQKTSEGQHSSK